MASPHSSLQPTEGFENDPQITSGTGLAVYVWEARGLARSASKAPFQGSAPAATLVLRNASCSRLTTTPGWRNAEGPGTPPSPTTGGVGSAASGAVARASGGGVTGVAEGAASGPELPGATGELEEAQPASRVSARTAWRMGGRPPIIEMNAASAMAP